MALTLTKINKFGLVYQPLTVTYSIDVVQRNGVDSDGVSIRQTYDSIGGGFMPDYTLFPLVLQPSVYVYDPDEIIGKDIVNVTKDVANWSWYVIENGTKTLLQNDTQYNISTDNATKGRLRVMRNVLPDSPITLVFEGQYLDPRTSDVHPIQMSILVRSEIYQLPCSLELDIPSQLFYNPWKNQVQKVTASIFSGSDAVDATKCKCVWEMLANDGVNWTEIGEDIRTLFGKVSDDTMSLDVNMEYMGRQVVIRCYGIVTDTPSALSSLTKDSAFAYKQFKITRKLPKFNASLLRFPNSIESGIKEIAPKVQIDWVSFSTDNPEQELDVQWSTARVGQTSFTRVASGLEPRLKTNLVTSTQAQQVKVEISERGPWSVATDGDRKVLTTGDGKILMIR